MADGNQQDFPTIIGPDASFKGELTFEKGLRLVGKLDGRISTAGRLHIAKEAHLQAEVESGTIIVEGEVKGNLTANDRIELKQTARVVGDLRAAKMTVEDGAIFDGHVSVGPDAVKKTGGPPPQTAQSTIGVTMKPGAVAPPLSAQPVK
jgi:cytoskeletal protein CcmA (bactofilin family)